jgi:hypothetical protein
MQIQKWNLFSAILFAVFSQDFMHMLSFELKSHFSSDMYFIVQSRKLRLNNYELWKRNLQLNKDRLYTWSPRHHWMYAIVIYALVINHFL